MKSRRRSAAERDAAREHTALAMGGRNDWHSGAPRVGASGPLTADVLAADFLGLLESFPARAAAYRANEAAKARELRLHGDGWAFWARAARYHLAWWTPDRRWSTDLMFLDRCLAGTGHELLSHPDERTDLWGITAALKTRGVWHLVPKLWEALPERIARVVLRRRERLPPHHRYHPLEVWWHLDTRAAVRRLGLPEGPRAARGH
jgi:hypothetical protein